MLSFFDHPAVQGGVAPFVVSLAVAALFFRFRLAGLAIAAGFCTAAYFINGLAFSPLTVTRKIILLAPAAAFIGIVFDSFARHTWRSAVLLALMAGALSVWVFWSVLAQKDLLQAVATGAGTACWIAAVVLLTVRLAAHPVRAGAAGLGLGLGAGAAAILGATASYGMLGIAVGASAGAFLLVQMMLNRKTDAGVTFTLAAGLLPALAAAGAMLLAQLPWHALALLLLAPLAAHLPVPERVSVPAQAVILSALTLAAGAVPGVLMWRAEPGLPF